MIYHDTDMHDSDEATAECSKCLGPCSTGCRWYMGTHSAEQRLVDMRAATEFDMLAAIRAELEAISRRKRASGDGSKSLDKKCFERIPKRVSVA
jgi:hypothetical protein